MSETTGQIRTLARATFAGFFESELMTPGLPQIRLVVVAITTLMFPAIHLPLRAWMGYAAAERYRPDILDLLMWPHKLLFITLAMVGTAVVTLVIWDNVFPDRRDAFVIGHLPMRTVTVVAARLVALTALMGLIALGSAAPSAVFYGIVAGGFSSGGIVRTVVAHFVATMGGSIFAFLLLLSLQGVLINLVPGRWLQRAMMVLQFFFVIASLEALLLMGPVVGGLEKAMTPGSAQPWWMAWAPPAWFLGLYEVIAGTSRPVSPLAASAAAALGVLLPLALGLYAFTYQRLTRRAVESRDTERLEGVGGERAVRWVSAALARAPISNAVCRFTLLTLSRSRRHRLLLTIFAGVGTTAAAMSVLVPLSRGRLASALSAEAILPVGLILMFFLVVGLRTLVAIPAEPAANWVFKLSDAEDARLHVRGGVGAVVGIAVLPLIALLAPLHLYALGLLATVIHSSCLLGAGLMLPEIVLTGFRRVPFTSAYAAPAGRARLMWPVWFVGFMLFCFGLPALERGLLARPVPALALAAGLAGVAFLIRFVRERDFRLADRMLTFDEGEEDAPVTLDLSGAVPMPAPPR